MQSFTGVNTVEMTYEAGHTKLQFLEGATYFRALGGKA